MSKLLFVALACLMFVPAAMTTGQGTPPLKGADLVHDLVMQRLPIFGHRNWICIVDSAYPKQSNLSIETVYAGGDHVDCVKAALDVIRRAKHVRPTIYLDGELQFVPEADAKGIDKLREKLTKALGSQETQSLPHEKIIHMLDDSAKLVNVLIIKTDLTLPYTSVFIRLDCGYWPDDAEKRLREKYKGE